MSLVLILLNSTSREITLWIKYPYGYSLSSSGFVNKGKSDSLFFEFSNDDHLRAKIRKLWSSRKLVFTAKITIKEDIFG